MDYLLPDGNGVEATKKILSRWPETKVLMMSGSEVPDVHILAFASGCVGFLAKNRPWGEVVGAVRRRREVSPCCGQTSSPICSHSSGTREVRRSVQVADRPRE